MVIEAESRPFEDYSEATPAPEKIHKVGFVLDFDRTIGDVDVALARLYSAVSMAGIDTKVIEEARIAAKNVGASFNPMEHVPHELHSQVSEHFLATEGPSLLYPDAKEFIDRLTQKEIPHEVVSTGDTLWQALKIGASGYDGPITIIDNPYKGRYISESRTNSGIYDLGARARNIILIDDKADAFQGLPQDCKGYFIQRSEAKLKNQEGKLPPHVATIRSLNEIVL